MSTNNSENSGEVMWSKTPLALFDLLIVVAVLVTVKQSVLLYSVVFAGPASTLTAMCVATFLLYRRGSNWQELGFRWPDSWLKAFLIAFGIFLIFLPTAGLSSALADLWFENVGASGRFDFVKGNLLGYLVIMAVVWTHGSFFEELLFRAFIVTKLTDVLGGQRWAGFAAVVLAAIFFGYRHFYYQGMHGALVTGCIGLVFGFIYLKLRKSTILPLILAHGAINTIAQTDRFLS